MKYVVIVKSGYDEMRFEFKDTLRANMFAEMALKNIVPDVYSSGEQKKVSVSIELVKVDEAEAETAEPEVKEQKEAE